MNKCNYECFDKTSFCYIICLLVFWQFFSKKHVSKLSFPINWWSENAKFPPSAPTMEGGGLRRYSVHYKNCQEKPWIRLYNDSQEQSVETLRFIFIAMDLRTIPRVYLFRSWSLWKREENRSPAPILSQYWKEQRQAVLFWHTDSMKFIYMHVRVIDECLMYHFVIL